MRCSKNRGRGPGSSTSGSVTIEASFSMVSLIIVFAMLVQCMSVIALNSALTSCAREAARVAALELDPVEAERSATAQVAHCHPGSELRMETTDTFIDITVSRRIRILGLPHTIQLSSTASAMKEPAW